MSVPRVGNCWVGPDGADRGHAGALLILVLLVSLSVTGCASSKGPPDAGEAEARLSAAREGERALIESKVPEQDAAQRLMLLLEERDRLLDEYVETLQRHRKRIHELKADYDADRESLEEALAEFNATREQAQRQLVDSIQAMKSETSARGWKAISKYQLKRLDPRALVYAGAPEED